MGNANDSLCDLDNSHSHIKWTASDAILWKFFPAKLTGGGTQRLHHFKNSWVVHNSCLLYTSPSPRD